MTKFPLRFGLGFICLFGIINCSRLDIAVNWADTYIVHQVDDYFDLSSQQNTELKTALKNDIAKIRKRQFPEWAKTLREFSKEVRTSTLSEARFNTYFKTTLDVTKNLQPAFTETAVKFISGASREQLVHFERALRKKNIENEEKIQNREKARNEARKKYLRGIEMWVDSLSKDQDQLLNRHLNENPFPQQALIKNRNHVLAKFVEAQKSPEDLKNFVRNYYQDKTKFADPEYQQALTHYQAELAKFTYQLVQSLDEKQKNLLCENLAEKAGLLERLAVN